jgi:hypothetical protein
MLSISVRLVSSQDGHTSARTGSWSWISETISLTSGVTAASGEATGVLRRVYNAYSDVTARRERRRWTYGTVEWGLDADIAPLQGMSPVHPPLIC